MFVRGVNASNIEGPRSDPFPWQEPLAPIVVEKIPGVPLIIGIDVKVTVSQ